MVYVSCRAVHAVSYEHFAANDGNKWPTRLPSNSKCVNRNFVLGAATINTSSSGQEDVISQLSVHVCVRARALQSHYMPHAGGGRAC